MKTFENNAQLAHAYANATHDSGKAHNMFFEGNVIYSYGYHYEIAHRVKTDTNEVVIFINDNGYSNSTAKHVNHVVNAIPEDVLMFRVPFVRPAEGYGTINKFKIEYLPAIIERMALNVKNFCHDQINARSNPNHFFSASRLYRDIIEICDLFNLNCPAEPENWNEAQNKATELNASAYDRKISAELKAMEKERENLNKWLNYDYNGQLYNVPVHLRVSKCGQFVETTKGAKVTISEAKILLARLKAGHDVKGYDLEGFKVIENTSDHVKIGCHVINWSVINQTFNG